MDMRWPIRFLIAVAFSVASLSSAATLDFTTLVGSLIASGNSDSASYSGNADFGTVNISANPSGSDITWSSGNGLGVDCSNWNLACVVDTENQIDWPEVLQVTFQQPLFVSSIGISQLTEHNASLGPFTLHVVDAGAVAGSGFDIAFNAGDATAGQLDVAVNRFASSISFVPTAGILSDFSLARITVDETLNSLRGTSSPIPEPSSVVMLLIGGALVASQVRKLV
jgi:hypothetical protein